VSNPLASPSAYYSAVESHVHQMVTMRAKDRLGLAPALLGSNCGYRRAVLAPSGGFPAGALLEDSELTLAFYQAGYRVRFAEDAVAYHEAPRTLDGYLKQHRRWARGFNDAAKRHTPALMRNRRLTLPLRLELFLFATGYLDRITLLGAGVLTVLSFLDQRAYPFPRNVLFAALLTPLAQVIILFVEQRVSRAMWLRLPLIAVFYVFDILAATQAMVDSVLRRTRVWRQTARTRSRQGLEYP
jgi:cellulose synthase/poly-beta-1,6-N-acetylglucosamine synthase-like glycosyltransferase